MAGFVLLTRGRRRRGADRGSPVAGRGGAGYRPARIGPGDLGSCAAVGGRGRGASCRTSWPAEVVGVGEHLLQRQLRFGEPARARASTLKKVHIEKVPSCPRGPSGDALGLYRRHAASCSASSPRRTVPLWTAIGLHPPTTWIAQIESIGALGAPITAVRHAFHGGGGVLLSERPPGPVRDRPAAGSRRRSRAPGHRWAVNPAWLITAAPARSARRHGSTHPARSGRTAPSPHAGVFPPTMPAIHHMPPGRPTTTRR